ncbi:DNA replication terminus site-binding protein [Aeromonas schubertii]|uniref:DNA replication terminus site-binding protein n=1 Tax=Aeromonas schubertii TaxID=652 RepID=UPI0038B5146C
MKRNENDLFLTGEAVNLPVTFTPVARLRHLMHELEGTLVELGQALTQAPLKMARVHPLPPVPEGGEEDPIVRIEVATLEGEEARAAAIAAFGEHTLRPGCSTKSTLRLPGLLHYPAAAAVTLAPLIERINCLKGLFQEEVQQAGERDDKFQLVHQALPGTITLQVYRQLPLYCGELLAIGFTWADKQAIRKLGRQEVIAMLERSKGYVPAIIGKEEWIGRVEREIVDVKRLPPGAELRIRRPVKTHPMANLRWGDRESAKQQVKASLPLIVCSDAPLKAKPLGDYPNKPRQPRNDRRGAERLLIERLHLYVRDEPLPGSE